jgi:16S rRNA (guanine966-N2)-methyltransferase
MRIIGGRLGGRVLRGPTSDRIRPTSDRLRETLFNILEHAFGDPIPGARVIDLFAGTGALALESLSRGARYALMVEDGAEARALIRANVEALGLGGETRVFRRDARKLGAAPAGEAFDIAFLDPPYGRGMAEPTLVALAEGAWLKPEALIVVEETAGVAVDAPGGYARLETRGFGDTALTFLRKTG